MPTPSGLPTYAEYKAMMAEGTELENLGDILDKKYKLAEAKATKRYMDDLYIQGKSITDQDFENYFNEELSTIEKRFVEPALDVGFGDYKELIGGIIPTAPAYNLPPAQGTEPTLGTALSRQQKVSRPIRTIAPAVSIDYEAIQKDMQTDKTDPEGNTISGLPEADAKANVRALEKTVDYIAQQNPDYDRMRIFETVTEQLQGLGDVATKEIPMDTSGVFFDAASKDPYIAAFQQQITNGEIPDYSSVQARFLKEYLQQKDETFKNENRDSTAQESTEYKTIKTSLGSVSLPTEVIDYIRGTDPRLVPPVYNEKIDAAIREDGQTVKRQLLVKPEKLSQDINAVLEVRARKNSGSDNWFLDPDRKAMVLADPESFVDQGFFTDESRIGGTRETIGSWTIRAAMSPLNMIAGFAQEEILEPAVGVVMGGVAEGLEAVGAIGELEPGESYFDPYAAGRKRKAQRAKETPLYEANPVLANIALNKGFTGEAMDIANALNLEGIDRYVTIGGGFATDLLDPTFAVTSGLIKGGKNISKLSKAQRAFNIDPSVSKYKVFANTVLDEVADDFNILAYPAKKIKKKYNIEPFDIRMVMIDDLARSSRSLDLAANAKSFDEYEDLIVREALENTPHYRQMQQARNQGKSFDEALDMTIRNADEGVVKINQDFVNKAKFLREIEEQGGNYDDAFKRFVENGGDPKSRFIDEIMSPRLEDVDNRLYLNPRDVADIRRKLYTANARSILFESAPELTNLKNVVAVTKNTYAHPEKVADILANAVKSERGEFLFDLSQQSKVKQVVAKGQLGESLFESRLGIAQPRITNAFVLNEDNQKVLQNMIDNDPLLTEAQRISLRQEVNTGILNFDNYRILVDSNVDNVARSMTGAITAQDVERLRTEAGELLPSAKKLLEPAETRTGGEWLTKQIGKVYKKLVGTNEPLWIHSATVQQRKLVQSIKQQTSALDSALRSEVRGLVNNEELRNLYGVTRPITRMEAVGVAIVGPKVDMNNILAIVNQSAQTAAVNKSVNWALNRLFFKMDYVENLTDGVVGLNKIFKNNLLNSDGQVALEKLISDFTKVVTNDPASYVSEFEKLIIRYQNEILSNNDMLIKGVVPSQINKLTPELIDDLLAEVMAGQYYFAKSANIIDTEVLKFIGDDSFASMKTYTSLTDKLSQDLYIDIPEELLKPVLQSATAKLIDDAASIGDIKMDMFLQLLADPKTRVGLQKHKALKTRMESLLKQGNIDANLLRTFFTTEPELIEIYYQMDRLLETMVTDGQSIIRRNGLNDGVTISIDDSLRLLDDMFTDENFNLSRAVFGEKIYDDLQNALFEGRNKIMSDALDRATRRAIKGKNGFDAFKRLLNTVSSFRYTVLLGLRPRFHGANVITANAITYPTVGKLATAGGNPFPIDGFNVAFKALNPNSSKYYSKAVTTPSGKVYTYGEISELIYSSGIRSEHDFVQNALSDRNMIAFLKKDGIGNQLQRMSGRLGEFTTQEDVVFRAQIMINALKEGRSEADAINLARRSMFDYNDMAEWEKQMAANYFIFYSFSRQNYATLIKAFTDPKLLKRYTDILKFKRGTEMLFSELQGRNYYDNAYIPDYMKNNRAILDVVNGEEYDFYLTSPPIPAIDSIMFLSGILNGDAQRLMQLQMMPELKVLFGIEDPFKQGPYIAPEFINAWATVYDDPYELAEDIQFWTGGKVTPISATNERGGVTVGSGTYRYDLTEPQMNSFTNILRKACWGLVDVTGAPTTMKDWIKLVGGTEGSPYGQFGISHPFSGTGLSTPMKGMKPEAVTVGQSWARKMAIQEELRKAVRERKAIEEQIIREELNK